MKVDCYLNQLRETKFVFFSIKPSDQYFLALTSLNSISKEGLPSTVNAWESLFYQQEDHFVYLAGDLRDNSIFT